MKKFLNKFVFISILFSLMLSACEFPFTTSKAQIPAAQAAQVEVSATHTVTATPTPTEALVATATPKPAATPLTPTFTPTEEIITDPCAFQAGVNPLTGLAVDDPSLLDLPPALISVSNFPASARPQAGLNTSAMTFEIAIGEGMTRFLALFYGSFPQAASGQTEGQIGPIRSGRLPYENLRKFYNGFLVMASAYSGVASQLSHTTSIFGSDTSDINSALINISKLQGIAEGQAKTNAPYLQGMCFSNSVPSGGMDAAGIWVFYSHLNQIRWDYDASLGSYIRSDIATDGSGKFTQSSDRLTDEPLAKENVIVIFAEHDFQAPTLIDIKLDNLSPRKALLFRDGQMFEIYWTTEYGDHEKETGLLRPIRFVDAAGNPVNLKPGTTWVHFVTHTSYIFEADPSRSAIFNPDIALPGSGLWAIRYKGKY